MFVVLNFKMWKKEPWEKLQNLNYTLLTQDIPLLLMRTVIQTVALYPHLIGFTMNILQRLIVKQVSLLYPNNWTELIMNYQQSWAHGIFLA